MWQALREELYPQGLEIVSVALDTLAEKALPFIEAANPAHPSLIDTAHRVDELFGFLNVPCAVWIDEQGVLVRPPETAWIRNTEDIKFGESVAKEVKVLYATINSRRYWDKYPAALRDWVANGAKSRYALTPEAVLARSQPRPVEEALGAAHFELGQHLHLQGLKDLAVEHFKQAHRLQPDNWTYRRQAWSMVNPQQGPTELYESDWLTDVRKIGAENYYAPLDMD